MGILCDTVVLPKYLGENWPMNLYEVFMIEGIFTLDS